MSLKSLPHISPFDILVYDATAKIPAGKVSCYQEIARIIGQPKAARAVGNALNRNPFAPQVPCHRVIRSDGQIGGFFHGSKRKAKLLQSEGVMIKQGRVDSLFFYGF